MQYTSYHQVLNSTSYQELKESPMCDKILRRAQKEKAISQLYSVLSNDSAVTQYKIKTWRESLLHSQHELPRDEYLKRLSQEERAVVQHLLCKVLYNLGFYYKNSIYYTHAIGVMAIGSTTYSDEYRESLKSAGELSESTKQRIQKKGNDIDLIFYDCTVDTDRFLSEDRFRSYNGSGTEGLIQNISDCLDINNIRYEVVNDKHKIGTTAFSSRGKVIESELINYGGYPCFIVYFPNIRPIHIKFSNQSGSNVIRREYLQARPFSNLFDQSFSRSAFSDLIENINQGIDLDIPKTLEEKLASLDQRKRSNYKEKLLLKEMVKKNEKEKRRRILKGTDDLPF